MSKPDFASSIIHTFSNALHFMIGSPNTLGEWVVVQIEEEGELLMFLATEADADHAGVPHQHRPAVVAEVAKPRRDDELLMFDIRGGKLEAARVDRARIDRELGPRYVLDARNHFPMPWPKEWHGPYALDQRDTYRIDTPDCQVLARVQETWDYEDLDDEGQPQHHYRLELGVTRAMDPALASDAQIAEITARFRDCGPWADRTHTYERRHPSRRIFQAEVGERPEGTPWPEIQPLPEEMLGPPPGWEPVGSFSQRPLVFRIEGTPLLVEWAAPAGSDFFLAATGQLSKPSRFTISTLQRKPTDDELLTVFAMLGGAAFSEEKRGRSLAKAKRVTASPKARVCLSTAGWLRRPAGRA